MALHIGDRMPEFSALNEKGERVYSKELSSMPCIIFFYPKDDTYLCTKEACSFSADSVEEHAQFAKKHMLKYSLLSDTENDIRTIFGVPKGLFGLLPGRVTYCFDAQGKVLLIINSSFSAEKHVQDALKVYS